MEEGAGALYANPDLGSGLAPLALAGGHAAGGPQNPDCRLRDIAGDPLRPARTAYAHHGHRHQRRKPGAGPRPAKIRYELRNLEFRQLSISDVQKLGRKFRPDRLHRRAASSGRSRCRAALSARRPGSRRGHAGLLIYAAVYGRTGIYMMTQDYCRLLGITPSEQELDDLSAALSYMPADHPLGWLRRKTKDFNSPDGLIDALAGPLRSRLIP